MHLNYALDYVSSPNQTYDPARAAPTGIVIHHWGADGQTHNGVVAYLTRPGGTSSANYVASAGRATCLVDPIDTAWHAGVWPANYEKIGIECRPEMSDADFQTVAEVIAYLRGRFGPLPLSGHKDHYPTACPGRWYPRLDELSELADRIAAGEQPTAPIDEEIQMRLVRSKQSGTIYAVTPTEVTTIYSVGLYHYLKSVYGTDYVDLDNSNISTLRADADARRARLVAEIAASIGDVDEEKLAAQIAPALVEPIANALAKAGPIDADKIRTATAEAVRSVFAAAAKE